MACDTPAKGFQSKFYYVPETVCGVTPATPAWQRLRAVSGNTVAAADASISQELTGKREVTDFKLGSITPTFDVSIEFSAGAYSSFAANAMGSDIVTYTNDTAVVVTVNASAKTFTRAAGSFSAKVSVGSIVRFASLTGSNALPWRVKAFTATTITVEDSKGLLADESSATTTVAYSQKTTIGNVGGTFSVLEHRPDADSGNGEYNLTTGVECVGFSLDGQANARLTGTLNLIGRVFTPDADLPAGSTFPSAPTAQPYHYVDGNLYIDGATKKLTGVTFTQDNAASAQFELGSGSAPSFITRDVANNTVSLTGFFRNSTLIADYLAGTPATVSMFFADSTNAVNIECPLVQYTAGSSETGGTGDIGLSVEGRAMATDSASSVTFHELIA